LQGKQEQAEAIRRRILETQPLPWPVITPDGLARLEAEALNPQTYNRQAKLLLFEYAVMDSVPRLFPKLAELQFGPGLRVDSERAAIENKYTQDCQGAHQVLNQKIERYGVDYRNPLNQAPGNDAGGNRIFSAWSMMVDFTSRPIRHFQHQCESFSRAATS